MADSDGDGDAVHVLDVDSDLGEPPLDSAARSAAAAAEMPPPTSRSNKASSSATPSIDSSTSTSSSTSSPFVVNDRSVATGGALLVALLLLVIAALFLRARRPPNKNRRSAAGTRAALLAGPSGAGKTTLFLDLTKKRNRYGTVASMTENEGVAVVLSCSSSPSSSSLGNGSRKKNALRRVPLVDAPGHPRLRALAASRAPAATALVFVVDASDFLPRKAEAAEALAGLLAGSWRRGRKKKGIPVLLACNKSDRGEAAHSPEFIRKRLEKEIEALISSAATGRLAGGGGGNGGGGDNDSDDDENGGGLAALLRRAGEPFSFAGLARAGGPALETCSCSALKGEIGSVSDFLAKHG